MGNSGTPGLLCVHAHPDDESMFTGGVLAQLRDRGVRTAVVTCTRREGDARVNELRESLGILGAGEPRLLGYDDSAVGGDNWVSTAPFDDLVDKIVWHIRDFRPTAVMTYDAFGTYGHPDHIRVHRATLAAVTAAGVDQFRSDAQTSWTPSYLYLSTLKRTMVDRHWAALFGSKPDITGLGVPGVPDAMVDVSLDVRPWFDDKWAALCAHRTETARGAASAHFANLPVERRRQFLGEESYIRWAIPGGSDADLF